MANIIITDEQWGALLKDMKARAGTGYGPNTKFSNEDVLRNLKAFIEENGRLPKNDEIQKATGYSRSQFYGRVGNLANVENILGVPKSKKRKSKKSNSPAVPVKIDSAKKDQYLDTFCSLAAAKGNWCFNIKTLKKGFIETIGEYDEHVIKHFWGNALRMMAAAKELAGDNENVVQTEEANKDSSPEIASSSEKTIAIDLPESPQEQSSVVKIIVEIPKDMDISKLVNSVKEFTNTIVIRITP